MTRARSISIGCDHAAVSLKDFLKEHLSDRGFEVKDMGTDGLDSVDYPDFALAVSRAVQTGESELGILVCGTGIGMAIAANKVRGIRAANCSEPCSARLSREHNNANVLTLGARIIGPEIAVETLDAFLDASFSAGRHERRLGKIADLESGE